MLAKLAAGSETQTALLNAGRRLVLAFLTPAHQKEERALLNALSQGVYAGVSCTIKVARQCRFPPLESDSS